MQDENALQNNRKTIYHFIANVLEFQFSKAKLIQLLSDLTSVQLLVLRLPCSTVRHFEWKFDWYDHLRQRSIKNDFQM